MIHALLLLAVCAAAYADGELRTRGVENLAHGADIEASSSAGAVGAKYGIDSANDGDMRTLWASGGFPEFPITIALRFPEATAIDTLAFVQATNAEIYTNWKSVRLEFSAGEPVEKQLGDSAAPVIIRFERRTVEWVKVVIVEPHDPAKHYVTLTEVMAFDDPEQKVTIKMPPTEAWKNADVTPQGRESHPCVYITPEDVALARGRIETEEWAKKWFDSTRARADEWVARDEAWIASLIPEEGASFAYGFTGCPICRATWGTWGGARCSFDDPGHVTCANGHVLPDEAHPDPGTGYEGPDGRIYYFVGSYNAWVTETLQFRALQPLAYAHTLTGDEKYAARAAFIMDLLADIYPSCDAGSWDYPSNPPSGRFCRPWYQVARVLIHYTDWYDQIHDSASLDEPSVREGMTRRENIEGNLLQNGATYCYTQSLKGRLHNGEADYIRGALAVGCCLGIPWYIDWAYDGPYGILSLVRNNVDRDGRYFETSTGYADHTRNLYLTFAEPLRNYRSEKYPDGINLYDDGQFRSFYVLPQLGFNCIGKSPRYGDSGPDVQRSYLSDRLTSSFDYRLAERIYARVSEDAEKAKFASLLLFLSGGDVRQHRAASAEMPWLLFHGADPPEEAAGELHEQLQRRIHRSEFFGQKGIAILRSGSGPSAQAALIRYGPTLNHGHYDDLNLNYYALGHELTYDLGYGLGSTHTQVGWSRQTASHNLVLVDETSQGQAGSGSGGSLHQFADLPGLKLMEVSSDASYVQQGVSVYRRLLALIGEGAESYVVDVFRVVGGKQHDYLLHSIGDVAEFEGVEPGAAEQGSLAGPELKWGEMQLNDGDMDGFPNKPYWSPPPGNGLGFLMSPQRGKTDGSWTATWPVPEGDGCFRLTMLGQPGTEVITAWAPGIYPRLPKARYAIARRKGEDLASTFIGVLEPYARRLPGRRIEASEIAQRATASAGEVKLLPKLGVLLHKATAAGDELRWSFEVAEEGEYLIAIDHYESPLYGQVQLAIDGRPVGDELVGTGESVRAAPLARVGQMRLTVGTHQASLRATRDDGTGRFLFGVRAMWVIPASARADTEARPFIQGVNGLPCQTGGESIEPAGLIVTFEQGSHDVVLAAGDADAARVFRRGDMEVTLQGRFGHVREDGEGAREVHLVGSKRLVIGDLEIVCGEAELTGEVARVDEAGAIVETSAKLPTDGRLKGQVILLGSPRYSRNAPHRIARVEAMNGGSRILLESPSLILGTGILEDDPESDTEFVSLLAHEYARSDSVTGTQFFSGKRIEGEGFETNIVRTDFGQLMRCHVESTQGMSAGDEFIICDVQRGDRFRILTLARLRRQEDGRFSGTATTEVTVRRGGEVVATIQPEPGTRSE